MKFSERWLREWVSPPVSTAQLGERLTMAGLEVESITPLLDLQNVRIGQVLEVERHPSADRLHVCQVNVGAVTPLTIICGAANVRPGLKVAVAMIGAVLPGDFKIKQAKIRGIESCGMLCSASELGLAESSSGILELPEDATIGMNLSEYLQLPDQIIEVNLTPNRGDCLSIAGIAREVGVIYPDATVHLPTSAKAKESILDTFPVRVLAPLDCPRYVGRVIRDLNMQAVTPLWMQERLRRSDIRSIHPVVDVTNYVMLELGQPMHAFDLSTLSDEIRVRRAAKGETIQLLDGQEMKLDPENLVIADAKQVLALAGIRGGVTSGVTTMSKDIFLESAYFTPTTVARTVRGFNLQTDGSHRFERGVDPYLQRRAMERATELLLSIAGGKAGPITEIVAEMSLPQPVVISLRHERIKRILGVELPSSLVVGILQRLGMVVEGTSGGWKVKVPSYRFDIRMEVDLIEELARIYGYENIESRYLSAPLIMKSLPERELSLSRLRDLLTDKGYTEAINYSFVEPTLAQRLDPQHQALALSNPLSADMSVMRTSLWPGLVQSVLFNIHRQQTRVRLFEIGVCFIQEAGELKQIPKLGGIVVGDAYPEQWSVPHRNLDFYDVKGDIEALLSLTHNSHFRFIPAVHPALDPGKCAQLQREGKNIGYIGELHPNLQQELELPPRTYVFEFCLESLLPVVLPVYETPSKYPSVRRDVAFVVDQTILNQQIQDKIKSCVGELLKNIQLFDIYQGEGIDSGKKSIALGLTFQLPSRTLIDQEIDEAIHRVVTMLKHDFNATLRE